jgi:hypothetical protein
MKKLKILSLSLLVAALALSCSKQDEYLKYIPEDEGTPIGRPEVALFLGGYEKVKLYGLLSSDPKVKKVGVFWNEGAENKSFFFDVDLSENRLIEQIIPIPEGTYNFEVFTYDAEENRSMATTAPGEAYGPNYVAGIFNRIIKSYNRSEDGNIHIEWRTSPENSVRTEVSYLKNGSEEPQKVVVDPKTETTVLEDPVIEEPDSDQPFVKFNVTSVYLPDPVLAFEEFTPAESSEYTVNYPPIGLIDVTSLYIKNAGPGIVGAERDMNNDGGKWGVPQDWNVTENVRNQRNSEVGGWKSDSDGIVHFESKDWGGPGFQNGKVWQSPTLPVGTYSFTVNYQNSDGDAGKEMFIAAAAGDRLPDIANLSSDALAFKEIVSGQTGEYTIFFDVTSETQVSLGLVITLGGNNDGAYHWLQFNYFKMATVPVKDATDRLKNPGPAIVGAERNMDNEGGKWGVPQGWMVTDNVRNQRNDEVGGWKSDNGGIVHFESRNWDGPGFENGKVWQSMTLPAGTYGFTVNYQNSDGDWGKEMYLAAAVGDRLPDIADMASGALAYKQMVSGRTGEHTVYFTLTQEIQVSVGLVITLGGNNNGSNHWLQFSYFKMAQAKTNN